MSLELEVGEVKGRMAGVEKRMDNLEQKFDNLDKKVDLILDKVSQARGSWKTLTAIVGAASLLGAGFFKLIGKVLS